MWYNCGTKEVQPMKNDTNIKVRVPSALYDELKKIADENFLTLSAVVKIALVEYVKKKADK